MNFSKHKAVSSREQADANPRTTGKFKHQTRNKQVWYEQAQAGLTDELTAKKGQACQLNTQGTNELMA